MSYTEQSNVGARIKGALATTSLSLSQSSATAMTTQDGQTVDRLSITTHRFNSVKAIGTFSFVAASSQRTAALAVNIQHSSDGTSWDTLASGTAATFGSTNGTTHYQTVETSASLIGARRYLRVQIPAATYADCSSGQGVFSGMVTFVFGGPDNLPAA